MRIKRKIGISLAVLALMFALTCVARASASDESMQTFLDSEMTGMRIQVNSTVETQPGENVTLCLLLEGLTEVHVADFNLSLFGFLFGRTKTLMASIADQDFSLNNSSREYNYTFSVPATVWEIIYGEMTMTYTAKLLGGLELTYHNKTLGFTMTYIENTHLKTVEKQLQDLNHTYKNLNETYTKLQQNYTLLKENQNELDNTRRVIIILVVATVFFAATTVYMIIRKPKESW